MSGSFTTRSFTLRDVREDDAAFLLALFKTARAFIFDRIPLPADQLELLIKMQFEAQRDSYTTYFPDGRHSIILWDEREIGQVWVSRAGDEYRLIDISILPSHQNRGIGSRVVKQLMEESEAAGLPLRCTVQVANPGSFRFHQRLGFTVTSCDLMDYCMEYQPHKIAGVAAT